MRFRWLLSLVAAFALTAYLGIWACNLLLRSPPEKKALPEPPFAAVEGSEAPFVPLVEPSIAPMDRSPDVLLSSDTVEPGGYLIVRVVGAKDGLPISLQNPFGDSPRLFDRGDGQAALIPVSYSVAPGDYLLLATDGAFRKELPIRVVEKIFPEQKVLIDESIVSATVESGSANDEYAQKVQPLKLDAIDHPLWEGPFALPIRAAYEVTSEFGLLRTVNGKPADRHGGIDLACARGTPVGAANAGRVRFAEQIALTGNTVMIEHGLGLKTWYYHMDSLAVSAGDPVEKGQTLGTVGSTGFSTGPHLHFAASIYKVYINPWMLLEAAPEI